MPNFPTIDKDPLLDDDLTLAEFVDAVFLLKRHKSPGFDQILNEDIILTTVEESEEAPDLNSNNIELLKFISHFN